MSAPKYYSHNAQQGRKPYEYNPGQYEAPQVHQAASNAPSQRSSLASQRPSYAQRPSTVSKPSSIRDVDLNASQYSIGSAASASTMRLGGVDYPVGSRIGSSGLFVIGAPVEPKESKVNTSHQSINGSQGVLVSKKMGYVSQGYGFEDWNWPSIRFSLFILIIAVMIALLAATIGLSVQRTDKCSFGFEWWQGPAVYHIPVGLFRDYGSDGYGDLSGVEYSMDYLQMLGVKVVMLSHVLPSNIPWWDLYTSYEGVDPRVGSRDQMQRLLQEFDEAGIHVIMEMEISYTSTSHTWFDESSRTTIGSGEKFEDFYMWNRIADPTVTYGKWFSSSVRSQYYQADNNANRPLLNWTNPMVVEEMSAVFDFWLDMGVDGFYLKDIADIAVPSYSAATTILRHFREILDANSRKEQKILIVDASYLEEIRAQSRLLHDFALEKVDMLHVPLSINKDNMTYPLSQAVDAGLQWQLTSSSPWVMWTVDAMNEIDRSNLAAVQLFLLTIPGTPCFVAGSEVEKFLIEKPNTDEIKWTSLNEPDTSRSIASEMYLKYIANLISLRNTEYSLRKDHEDVGADDKDFNLNFLFLDKYTMLIERYYGRSDAFYLAINFADRYLERAWSGYAPYGDVVAASQDGRGTERVTLQYLSLAPGEALVLRVKK